MASPFFLPADLCLSIFLMILQILMESFQAEFMVWSGYHESGGSKAHLANWSMGIRIRNLISYIELSWSSLIPVLLGDDGNFIK